MPNALTDDERGLLRGVLAGPDDATRRLVYADWLEERNDPRGAWLRAVHEGRGAEADKLRPKVDPDWAALFDGREHFSVLLPAETVDWLHENGAEGRPLRQLQSWATVQSDFRLAGVKPGDHVYPIRHAAGAVHVMARVCVAALRMRTEPFTDTEFLPRSVRDIRQLLGPPDLPIIDAADGSPVQFECPLPRPVLERLRIVVKKGERGLSSLKDGRLTNSTTIHGVFRLAPSSARDFGLLLFAPDLLDPAPPPVPGRKRK